jgi:hypothetical protein
MPYVVTHIEPKSNVPSLAQILSGENHPSSHKSRRYPGTITRYYNKANGYRPEDVRRLISILEPYAHTAACYPKSFGGQYRVFSIPKQSGGMRTICEPKPRLYADQVALRQLLEQDFHALQHTSAFAYCKGRNIKNCIQRHQANQSKWFLKLDFEDFFGSTGMAFVLSQLEKISPFSEVMADTAGKRRLAEALSICFLDDGLPQGTPISPMLTNLVMIPFDHMLNKKLHALGFVYTRYADDIQISHKQHFQPEHIIKIVEETLIEVGAPYHLKAKKTRYGSSSGRNFNLGLMLNGSNAITIGHKQHKLLKARLHSFAMDTKSGKKWSSQEASKLLGQLAYFESIEPDTASYIVKHLSAKLNMNVYAMLKHAATDPLAFACLQNAFAA